METFYALLAFVRGIKVYKLGGIALYAPCLPKSIFILYMRPVCQRAYSSFICALFANEHIHPLYAPCLPTSIFILYTPCLPTSIFILYMRPVCQRAYSSFICALFANEHIHPLYAPCLPKNIFILYMRPVCQRTYSSNSSCSYTVSDTKTISLFTK